MLAETVAEAGKLFGNRPVLVAEGGWAISYGDLDRISDELAAWLRGRGVAEGDVVALVFPATPEHYVAYAAIAKIGAITAAVNSRLTPVEREAVIRASTASLVLAAEDLCPSVGDTDVVPVELAGVASDLFRAQRIRDASPPKLRIDRERPVAIVFTSGTTGMPKGAVFCGRQLDFITSVDVGEEWGGGGPVMGGSVLSHLGPMTKFIGSLRRGNTLYMSSTWRAAEALRKIALTGATSVAGVPTQIALMLREKTFGSFDLSAVRLVMMGGGPATPSLVAEARERFGVPVLVRYSCTEAGIGTGTSMVDPDEDAEVSVGRPQPGVRVEVLGPGGEPVPSGEVGEVCLASPAVMRGYWKDPSSTAAAVTPSGAVRTGDLGRIDELGRLRLAGRIRERYVRGGFNVYPTEVEAVLSGHPAVRSVAVVGKRDEVMGEIGVAFVVAEPSSAAPDIGSLRDFASSSLARHKLPDELILVEDLPMTAMEKIDRRALEARVARRD